MKRQEELLDILEKLGVTAKENEALYKAVIQQVEQADKLVNAFQALHALGATVKENKWIYKAVIQQACSADKFATAFKVLQESGATVKENEALYNAVIQLPSFADKLVTAFKVLHASGATVKENEALYNAVIQVAYCADKFATAFEVLQESGATVKENEGLYKAVIQQAHFVDKLVTAFKVLQALGATPKENEVLYNAVVQNARYADRLNDIFKALNRIGLNLKSDSDVYELVIQQSGTDALMDCLEELNTFGMRASTDREMIEHILRHSGFDVLQWFNTHGFTYDAYREIFHTYFVKNSPLMNSPYLTSKVHAKLQSYLDSKHNVLLSPGSEGYATQVQEIKALIDETISNEKENETLTEGPLSKSLETHTLEGILKRMANANMDDVEMRYDDAFGYVLKFGQEPEIYVNELLRLANFIHVILTDEEVNLLGQQIQKVTGDFDAQALCKANIVVKTLPEAARRAITCYVGDRRYKNMNALFRGVAQTSEERYTWKSPVTGKENLIANLLTGCLVNWSAAELPRALMRSEERQILERLLHNQKTVSALQDLKKNELSYSTFIQKSFENKLLTEAERDKVKSLFCELNFLFPSYSLIDRGENLKASEGTELEAIKRRIASPVIAPSVLSFSVLHEGSAYFHKTDTTRTKVETDNSFRPVVNSGEGEILVPAGTSYRYTFDATQGTFFAREVNSPGVLPCGDFWSSTALAESFRNHLSKPYQESNANEYKAVPRPNHGLAHTYRVAVYLDVIIDYFAHHASDKTFMVFCQCITPEEREWMRVAAAFSISGRESEISAGENPVQYDKFRAASQKHMEDFLKSYPPPTENAAMRERMLDIVRWMGNPNYEKGMRDEHAQLSEDECLHRHFIHRILSIAHKLDLPRCYLPTEFENAMQKCLELSTEDALQKADYTRMIRYAIDLIKAHGSPLKTDITSAGALQAANKGYTAPFEKVSTNLRQLREITETITQPQRKESYQFPLCQEEAVIRCVLKMLMDEKKESLSESEVDPKNRNAP